jgi:acetoin utilization protein AcuC
MSDDVCLYSGEALGRYHFGEDHPFGPARLPAFLAEFGRRGLQGRVGMRDPVQATAVQIALFHDQAYIDRVMDASRSGTGFLDYGDTPAFSGVFEAAAHVVGSVLDAAGGIMAGEFRRAFVPIAGLHHARRERAAGFCVFNDCGVLIEYLLREHGLKRVAYVDIDAHHGDGVYYAFESDPRVFIVDMHEDGRYLYPGTGFAEETGRGEAAGSKMNIPMPPAADDQAFFSAWEKAEAFLRANAPDFVILQCGADSLAGDPITHLRYSDAAHRHATARLRLIADECCRGRLLALGGGGYNLDNLARAWCAVVEALCGGPDNAA